MKTTTNLGEFSISYYEQADIYKMFSEAEDRELAVWNALKLKMKSKKVLDIGCGNGRFLQLLISVTDNAIGIDQSRQQVEQGDNKLPFIVADASNLPFAMNTFDATISCWAISTITDEAKREKALTEALRVLKPNGKMYLIENDTPSEFEYYRGRHLNTKTKDYNDWLWKYGFTICAKVETLITFDNVGMAQYVFKSIWQEQLFALPTHNIIKNNVIIFEYLKK